MKRNWDLIRLMLLGIEDHTLQEIKDYNAAEIIYHLSLLKRSRYIDDNENRFLCLTVKGEELADILRDQVTYQKAMKIMKSYDGTAVQEILVGLIKKLKAEISE